MFSIFQPKELLLSVFSGRMDIHNHILPGVDDGSPNLDKTIVLLKEYDLHGIHTIVATPHIKSDQFPNTHQTIEGALNQVQSSLAANQLSHLKIRAAAEYLIDIEFERYLEEGSLLTIKDSYVLVELSFIFPPLNLEDIIYRIILKGYTPILAHPERYSYMQGELKRFKKLKKLGCHFQVNALSIAGHYGSEIEKQAVQLIKAGIIDFLGTDIHSKAHIDRLFEIRIPNRLHQKLDRIAGYTFELLS